MNSNKNKSAVAIVVALATVLLSAPPSHAWLLFHKPAFKGQVLDDETRQPLEGVAVEVVYHMTTFGLGPHGGTEPFDVREAVTDKKGIFHIPSYMTVIRPNAISSFATVIFYKPGYSRDYRFGNFTTHVGWDGDDQESFFYADNFGKTDRLSVDPNPGKVGSDTKWYDIVLGIIRLPRAKTNEERRLQLGGVYSEFRHKTPILNKLEAEEEEYLGIGRGNRR